MKADKPAEGSLSLGEAYARGAVFILAAIGSVFAYNFLNDLYRYLVHGNGAGE